MPVRVRFAPSPTGYLHVGGARTALFNYLFAKKYKGSFIIRIEDTDQSRHQESAVFSLLNQLQWLGLDWSEGPFVKKGLISSRGPQFSYRQKERLPIYKEKAKKLITEKKAYYCFMSPEEEARQKAKALKDGKPFLVSSPYRNLDPLEAEMKVKRGEKACIRFKTQPQNSNYVLKDMVRGSVHFPGNSLGDFILVRADDFPVYNFSCAVDDAIMEITHIFRGEEHLSNTIKQRLIQSALGFPHPQPGHLSIILGKDKKKLSKRSGAVSLEHYRQEGYLPEALINFLALLGWNPGTTQEFFLKKDLIQSFSVENFNRSSAIFDENKLLWLNEQHIKGLTNKKLFQLIKPFSKSGSNFKPLIPHLSNGFKTLKQSAQLMENFINFSIKDSAKTILALPKSPILIQKWFHFLQTLSKTYIKIEDFKSFQKQIQKEEEIKGKDFFMPLRCVLLGFPEGVEIKTIITLLKREQMIERAKRVLKEMDIDSIESSSMK